MSEPGAPSCDPDLTEAESDRAAWLDYCDADAAIERPAPIRQRWVQRTRKPHFCDRCKGDIYPTDRARVDTLKGPAGLVSVYVCETCTAPTKGDATAADRNGTKLYDEAEGVAGFAPDGSPC